MQVPPCAASVAAQLLEDRGSEAPSGGRIAADLVTDNVLRATLRALRKLRDHAQGLRAALHSCSSTAQREGLATDADAQQQLRRQQKELLDKVVLLCSAARKAGSVLPIVVPRHPL
jgi:hypothetical protein